MRRAGRLGDRSHVPADSHGCPSCAHEAIGPAVTGSSNVLMNNRAALRLNDRGVHSSCCGSNEWAGIEGAPRVLINRRPAHRVGDKDEHCGGVGNLVQGSPNILIGNYCHGGTFPAKKTWIGIRLLNDLGEPVPDAEYELTLPDGSIVSGTTNAAGEGHHHGIEHGICSFRLRKHSVQR